MNASTPTPITATAAAAGAASVAAQAPIASPLALALARLDASRAGLRAVMIPAPERDRHGNGEADAQSQGLWPAPLRALWRRLRRLLPAGPVTDIAASLAKDWWRRNPWRPVGEMLAQEASGQLLPLIRRHPLASTLGAATAGAAVVALLSWRWRDLKRPLRAAPLRASGWLAAQLAQPALQTALLMKLVSWMQRASTPAPSGPASTQANPATGAADAGQVPAGAPVPSQEPARHG